MREGAAWEFRSVGVNFDALGLPGKSSSFPLVPGVIKIGGGSAACR